MAKILEPFVKRLNYEPIGVDGEPLVLRFSSSGDKTAAPVNSELLDWADANPPKKNIERLITTTLGSAEGYGPNVNGDGFHEEHLTRVPEGIYLGNKRYTKPMYWTFVDFSKLYKFHKNRQHDQSFGEIPFAGFNPRMRRVEVIIDIYANDNVNQEILNNFEHNVFPGVSMGFRCVPGDVCSHCQNYEQPFPSRKYYCDCLKKNMLGFHPETGELIYAVNHNGYFFDLSIVKKPADRIAWGMKRIMSKKPEELIGKVPAIILADKEAMPEFTDYSSKLAEEDGSAQIIKTIEGENSPAAEKEANIPESLISVIENDPDPEFRLKGLPLMLRTDLPIDKVALNYLASQYPMSEITTTMVGCGIVPKPQEFQRMVLVSVGQGDYADFLEKEAFVFESPGKEIDDSYDCTKGLFNSKLAEDLVKLGMLDLRSYYTPFLMKRASMIKEAIMGDKFFEKFPIIENLLPIKKVPEDQQQRFITQGVNESAVGQYYQKYPNPVLGGGRYQSALPAGATVRHDSNPLIPLAIVGALYGGAKWISGFSKRGPLGKAMHENPLIAAGAFGAAAAISWIVANLGVNPKGKVAGISFNAKQLAGVGKDYMLQLLAGVALSYGLAGRAEKKREFGVQPSIVEEAFEKRPAVGSVGIALALRAGLKAAGKFASEELEELEELEKAVAMNDQIITEYPVDYIDKMARKSLVISSLKLKM